MANTDYEFIYDVEDYTLVSTGVVMPAGTVRWFNNATSVGYDAATVVQIIGDGTSTIAQLMAAKINETVPGDSEYTGDPTFSGDVTFSGTVTLPGTDSSLTTVTSLLNSWTGTINYAKRGGFVFVDIDATNGSSKTDNTALTLSSSYYPPTFWYFTLFGTGGVIVLGGVSTSGDIDIDSSLASISGSFSYPVI